MRVKVKVGEYESESDSESEGEGEEEGEGEGEGETDGAASSFETRAPRRRARHAFFPSLKLWLATFES